MPALMRHWWRPRECSPALLCLLYMRVCARAPPPPHTHTHIHAHTHTHTHTPHSFPNYFGEMTLWWGIFITCSSGLSGAQFASVASPLFVMTLLLFVSGIPLQVRCRRRRQACAASACVRVRAASGVSPTNCCLPPRVPIVQEEQAKRRWGGSPEYEAYRERTNLLLPIPKSWLPGSACCASKRQ